MVNIVSTYHSIYYWPTFISKIILVHLLSCFYLFWILAVSDVHSRT